MDDFGEWYGREYRRVLAACVAVAGDLEVAQEATDEAFVRACERWTRVAGMTSPGGWVQIVALNRMRRILRRRGLERLVPIRRGEPAPVEVADAEVWEAVGRLPSRQKAAIVLRYVHDLSETDTAELLGVTRGTVSASLVAARKKLRTDLADFEEELHHG